MTTGPTPQRVAVLGDALSTVPDIAASSRPTDIPDFSTSDTLRMTIAAADRPRTPLPLLEGTGDHVSDWLKGWHSGAQMPARDVACYFICDVTVSGEGQIWLDSGLVTSPEIMPTYVFNAIVRDGGGNPPIKEVLTLPTRIVEGPCVVLLGHGVQVYGHFLIEMLFRALVAQRAWVKGRTELRFLLDAKTPAWLLRILGDLGIGAARIEFFDPHRERVLLRQAVVPGLVHQDDGFHPFANMAIASMLTGTVPTFASASGPRVFIARKSFRNASSYQRYCLNEDRLSAIAEERFGFKTVAIEKLSWPEQIAVFKEARYVIGLWGSGLHNALFSSAGTRVGVIGTMNLVQSHIGALRGHELAYVEKGIKLSGSFNVDEGLFSTLLDAVMRK